LRTGGAFLGAVLGHAEVAAVAPAFGLAILVARPALVVLAASARTIGLLLATLSRSLAACATTPSAGWKSKAYRFGELGQLEPGAVTAACGIGARRAGAARRRGARIATKGLCKAAPVASNATAEGRQRYRRVEIVIGNAG
jgi:hypothetical protein